MVKKNNRDSSIERRLEKIEIRLKRLEKITYISKATAKRLYRAMERFRK
ncbi:MAG: hypothetical protein Q8R55_03190 [Candidatus Taylorbacteria bacterium]|nr:hypothetical protein [Candidatus Taylorbacteria bacterium]